MKFWRWLYPGIGVKRWIFVMALSVVLISAGVFLLTNFQPIGYLEELIIYIFSPLTGASPLLFEILTGILFIIIGLAGINIALRKSLNALGEKGPYYEVAEHLYQQKVLQKGPNIVVLGGGTGLSTLLRGLKEFTSNITAIVTVADNGGSSGKLRSEMGMLPPGDIRNCLVALADAEPLMKELFQYRFNLEGGLTGHNFGNLFIASLTDILGDFEEAIRESSRVLAIRGKVLPSTNENIHLGAVYSDGSVVIGETDIPVVGKRIERVFLKPDTCQPAPGALEEIEKADVIIVGPGSLYTSIIPNLLIKDIARAIKESSARKLYVCNVMTQPGETTGYSVSDHIKAIYAHSLEGLFEYVLVNNEKGSRKLARKYEAEGAFPVPVDGDKVLKQGVKVIGGNLLSEKEYLRHNSEELARIIFSTIESG